MRTYVPAVWPLNFNHIGIDLVTRFLSSFNTHSTLSYVILILHNVNYMHHTYVIFLLIVLGSLIFQIGVQSEVYHLYNADLVIVELYKL